MQPPSHQVSSPGDVLAPQDPQTGSSNPLPCAHWSLQAASEASSPLMVTAGLEGAWAQCTAGLTHAHRGAAGTPHCSCGRASPKSTPPRQHPQDPLASNCCRLSHGGQGCPRWGGGCMAGAEPGPPVLRAVLTARAVQKALCSAISHAASEHAARLFPGEQRRQLLPSCSTSLPHRLLVDGGGSRGPPGQTGFAPRPLSGKARQGLGSTRKEGTSTAAAGRC